VADVIFLGAADAVALRQADALRLRAADAFLFAFPAWQRLGNPERERASLSRPARYVDVSSVGTGDVSDNG